MWLYRSKQIIILTFKSQIPTTLNLSDPSQAFWDISKWQQLSLLLKQIKSAVHLELLLGSLNVRVIITLCLLLFESMWSPFFHVLHEILPHVRTDKPKTDSDCWRSEGTRTDQLSCVFRVIIKFSVDVTVSLFALAFEKTLFFCLCDLS